MIFSAAASLQAQSHLSLGSMVLSAKVSESASWEACTDFFLLSLLRLTRSLALPVCEPETRRAKDAILREWERGADEQSATTIEIAAAADVPPAVRPVVAVPPLVVAVPSPVVSVPPPIAAFRPPIAAFRPPAVAVHPP